LLPLFWFVFTSPDMRARAWLTWLLVAATCNRAGDGLDMAEVCGVVPRMPKEMLSSRSPIADRLYTRSVARVIVRRERLITTSSGK